MGAILDKFCQKMRDSGYEQKMRREVIDAGVKVYREQLRKDESGERLLYRRRNGDKEQREQAKKEKRNFWKRKKDKNGGADGEVEKRGIKIPIMAPYTPNGGWSKNSRKGQNIVGWRQCLLRGRDTTTESLTTTNTQQHCFEFSNGRIQRRKEIFS